MNSENNQNGFKMTEIGLLPNEWNVVRFDKKGTFQYGYTTSAITENTGIRLLRITDIRDDGFVNWNNVPFCQIDENNFDKFKLSEGDLLFARIGATTGKTCLIDKSVSKAIFASYLIRFIPNKDLDAKFVFYFTKSKEYYTFVNAGKEGKLKKGLSAAEIKDFKIPLPPLSEQKKIAVVLSAVHEAREKTEAVIMAAKELKKSLMKYLFTYGPVPVAEADQVTLKDTEIGVMPEEWEVMKLSDLSKLITKGSSPKWQGFQYSKTGIIFVRSQNVGFGKLELDEIAYLPEAFNEKEKKSIIEQDDLLINIVGASIGRAAIAEKLVAGGNLNQAVSIIRLHNKNTSKFIMYYLLTNYGLKQIHRQKKEIARANLSLQDIGNLLIPIPSEEIKRETVVKLSILDQKIESEQSKKQALDQLFKSLLSNLMTGRIRVNHLEL